MPDHLGTEQIAELRAELERILAKLERSMRATDEAMRPVELDQTAVGRLSRMDSLQNQGLTRNLQAREAVKLSLVHAALARIDAGSYGACTECSADVPYDRLLIFPEAPTCSACGDR
jgi:DnaK suppressor protein